MSPPSAKAKTESKTKTKAKTKAKAKTKTKTKVKTGGSTPIPLVIAVVVAGLLAQLGLHFYNAIDPDAPAPESKECDKIFATVGRYLLLRAASFSSPPLSSHLYFNTSACSIVSTLFIRPPKPTPPTPAAHLYTP